jgi:hypothetical protein
MNMTTSRRTDSEAKYESLLALNANDDKWNEVLKAFYNDYASTRYAFFDADKADGFMEDAYQSKTWEWSGWITWMDPESVFKSWFKWKPGQSYALKSAEMLHNEFVDQMISYTKTTFDWWEEDKKYMMTQYTKAYIYWFLSNHEKNIGHNMKSPGFKLLWLDNPDRFEGITASDFTYITPKNKISKASITLLDECVNHVLINFWNNNQVVFDINNVNWFVDGVKNQTNNVINQDNNASNDDVFNEELYWT